MQGTAVPAHKLMQLGMQQGQRPLFKAIECRAAREAEAEHGYGSPQHQAALAKAAEALKMYVEGKAYPDEKYWPHLQEKICYRTEREICCGGSKGSAKTLGGMLWLASGNPLEPPDKPVNLSYFYHPQFTGLVIRRNLDDLNEWVRTAEIYYKPVFQAQWIGGDGRAGFFRFPSGAVVRVGHIDDPRSYEKYFGKPIHRLLIEELIQVKPDNYIQLVGCVRSTIPEIRAQVLSTTNPWGGPYTQHVFDRFVEPKMFVNGNKIPILDDEGRPITAYLHDGITAVYPEPTIKEPVDPNVYKRLGMEVPPDAYSTRCFIPGRINDNPFLLSDKKYVDTLATMDDEQREALLLGIWNVTGGAMFKTFRPKGPLPGEPENANHVVYQTPQTAFQIKYKAPALQPWYHRVAGMDWGYEHECAIYFIAHDQATHRIHVYREMIYRELIPEMVGVQVARVIKPELPFLPNQCMTMWIGSDVEQERTGGQRSVLELFMKGLRSILQPNMVHSPELIIKQLEEEMMADGRMPDQSLVDAIRGRRSPGVVLRRVNTSPGMRILGWQLIRSFLNWVPYEMLEESEFDPKIALEIFFGENGADEFEKYKQSCFKRSNNLLPRLQIWDTCPKLIEALPSLQKSDKNPEDADKTHFLGMDRCDGLRHAIIGFKEEENVEPAGSFVDRKIDALRQRHPDMRLDDIIRARRTFEDEYRQTHSPDEIRIPKGARILREIGRDRSFGDY